MKILVNYDPLEANFLVQLAALLKQAGLEAVSTKLTLDIDGLLEKAAIAKVQGILLCNEATLKNLVSGKNPTLDQFRGSRLNYSVPVIVCNKLAHINTVPHGRWLLEKDLSKFKYLSLPPANFTFTALDSVDKFQEALTTISSSVLIAYDIETDLLNEKSKSPIEVADNVITCASYACLMPSGETKVYVLPFINFREDHWKSELEYEQAIEFFQTVNKLSINKVMHNGIYDCAHSIRYHAEPYNYILDTMALAHSEFSELPKTLDFVASYTLYDYQQWKVESDLAKKNKDIKGYWQYNGKDTWNTLRICIEQLKKLPAYARKNYAQKFKLVYPSLYCSFEGFKIDQKEREEKRLKEEETYSRALRELRIMVADPNFNPGSWQQKQKYLYEILGAKRPGIGKSNSQTDEKNLKEVALQHPLLAKVVERILDYMGSQKAIGTYYDFKQFNGRLLWTLNPFGTETERMACNASSFWCGTQVQNIPSYAKSMLIADDGYELCEPDANKSEARCTAYLAREPALIKELEDETRDFYRQLGVLFFQMKYEDVDDFWRNKILKKINHGTNYMMGGGTFLENIGATVLFATAPKLGIKLVDIPRRNHPEEMTVKQFATYLLELYHKPFTRIRQWYQEIKTEVMATGRLVSPLGHTRYFFGDISKDHKVFRSAVAHKPQNLSVSLLNIGFWNLYKECVLPSNGAFRLKAQIHDSCPFQYKKEERDIWVPKALKLLTNSVKVFDRTLTIPMDAKVGDNWGSLTKYKHGLL